MIIQAIIFSCMIHVVSLTNIRRAYFVLDERHPDFSLSNSGFQDKDTSRCIQSENCAFIVKAFTGAMQFSSKWYKANVALPKEKKSVDVKDCLGLKLSGETISGVYPLYIKGKMEKIPCDMKTDGGGWTVFQRRVDAAVDFNRDWKSYKLGFGDREKSFWLGLDLIHQIISEGESEMRIDVTNYQGYKGFSKYGKVYIGDESEKYKLSISMYSGTAGNSMSYMNNRPFTTYDRDNDGKKTGNCAVPSMGGLWYNRCASGYPNALYPSQNQTQKGYVTWRHFKKHEGGIVFIEMKFRRKTKEK